MAVYNSFIAILVILHSGYGTTATTPPTNVLDTKITSLEKDMEFIKSILNVVLKKVQATVTLSSQMVELQKQAILWKDIAAKQQATASKQQATHDALVKHETVIVGLNDQVKIILDKDSNLSTKQHVLESQLQKQASLLKGTATKQQLQNTESTLAAKIQELKSTDEKQIQGLNVQVKGLIEFDATMSKQHQVTETQVSVIDKRLSHVEGRLQATNNTTDECCCKDEFIRLNSTAVTHYNNMIKQQSTFENQVIGQLKQMNKSANKCGCRPDLDLLNVTLTNMFHKLHAKDCSDLYQNGARQSGVYTISPPDHQGKFDVYCDMETDGGGWTVFQRRQDGSVNFERGWDYYKNGFGNQVGEFWLGNEKLHRLTAASRYILRVDLEDWSGVKVYAIYTDFGISNEADKYKLTCGNYQGNAGNSLGSHTGKKFSTKDRDNDEHSQNCAGLLKGGWWFFNCLYSNLNGHYYTGGQYSNRGYADGVTWYHFRTGGRTSLYSLKHTEMKIRPATFKS